MSTFIIKVRTATCVYIYYAIALCALDAWADAIDRHDDQATAILVRPRIAPTK